MASFLRDLADQLDGGDVTLELGGSDVLLNPSDPVTFELEGESNWSAGIPRRNGASDSSSSGGARLELPRRCGRTSANRVSVADAGYRPRH
nr:amphi-Trp domain-containing protein [Natrinema salaciae]